MDFKIFEYTELSLIKYITLKGNGVDKICSQLSLGLVNGNGILIDSIMVKTKSKDLMDLSKKILKARPEFEKLSYGDIIAMKLKLD